MPENEGGSVTAVELAALMARLDEVRRIADAIDLGSLGDPAHLVLVRRALASRIRLHESQIGPALKGGDPRVEQARLL